MVKEKESDIVRAICDYLAYKKHFFWRSNNIPVFDPGKQGGFRSMPKHSLKGIPDIIIILKGGKVVFLEVKTATGVLSDSQKDFQAKCISVGAKYVVVRNLENVQALKL